MVAACVAVLLPLFRCSLTVCWINTSSKEHDRAERFSARHVKLLSSPAAPCSFLLTRYQAFHVCVCGFCAAGCALVVSSLSLSSGLCSAGEQTAAVLLRCCGRLRSSLLQLSVLQGCRCFRGHHGDCCHELLLCDCIPGRDEGGG